jgi:hypothetical protein
MFVGIDVAKAELVVACWNKRKLRSPNRAGSGCHRVAPPLATGPPRLVLRWHRLICCSVTRERERVNGDLRRRIARLMDRR